MWTVAEYDGTRHEEDVHALWLRSLPPKWALARSRLDRLFPRVGAGLVATDAGRIVGFLGMTAWPAPAVVAALFVDEPLRGCGIGRALFEAARDVLRAAGHDRALIGGNPFLWNGVPLDLPAATRFFHRLGCRPHALRFDQYRYLDDYDYPLHIETELARRRIRVGLAEASDADAVLALQQAHYPGWFECYSDLLRREQYAAIGWVKSDGDLLGTIVIHRPGMIVPGEPWACGEQWARLAPHHVGTFGALGIRPLRAGHGSGLVSTLRDLARSNLSLGYALAAFATEQLRQSGAGICFLSSSEAVPLFRRLGFLDWAESQVFEKTLAT
jgi:GNAT superfamily N-acetyltransferase